MPTLRRKMYRRERRTQDRQRVQGVAMQLP